MITDYNDVDLDNLLYYGDGKTTLVYFWATWCAPCKVVSPILKEVDNELGDDIIIAKVDADKNPELVSAYNLRGVPALLLFKKGEQLGKLVGAHSKQKLLKWVNEAN